LTVIFGKDLLGFCCSGDVIDDVKLIKTDERLLTMSITVPSAGRELQMEFNLPIGKA
jgi:hypothetical protein